MEIREGRLYFIKQTYFDQISDSYMKKNKESGDRPHYLAYRDKDGLCWMVPLSSNIEKYEKLIMERKVAGKNVFGLDIVKIKGNPAAFLFQDMIPVRPTDISNAYLIKRDDKLEFVEISNEGLIRKFRERGRAIAVMLQKGIVFTPTAPNIKRALEILEQRQRESELSPRSGISPKRQSLDELLKQGKRKAVLSSAAEPRTPKRDGPERAK